MTQHWMTYVKHSYDIIMEAECRASVNLEHELEAYLVHTFARYMEQPGIAEEPIAIKLMEGMNKTGAARRHHLERVAEECLLIDGLNLNRKKWPTDQYYTDMGQLALEYRAHSNRPPELFYEHVARHFTVLSRVLHTIQRQEFTLGLLW